MHITLGISRHRNLIKPEDQEELIDVIQRRLIERPWAEIASNTEETLETVREGRAQYGDFETLQQDLLEDEMSEPSYVLTLHCV